MKCPNCGSYIPNGMMICPDCREEIQMVPDYNPLEDVLTEEVRGSVHGATRPIRTNDISNMRRSQEYRGPVQDHSTRILRPHDIAQERRRMKELRIKKAKQRRRRVLLILCASLIAMGLLIFVAYRNSYDGLVRRANQAFAMNQLDQASIYFNRAVGRNITRVDAYIGLSKVKLASEDQEGAERILLQALDTQPSNLDLLHALIDFYIQTNQQERISVLMRDITSQRVLDALADYISQPPSFSLPEGTFSEVQEVSLTADGSRIYYTTDGTQPLVGGNLYTEPLLIQEGQTIVSAIAVNEKGVPSQVVTRTYTVVLPIASAPTVTPSTGQYQTEQVITIVVPDGYSAFYTLDGTDPSSSSLLYTEPIPMPEGTTQFSAILRNNNNQRYSGIASRVFVLDLGNN